MTTVCDGPMPFNGNVLEIRTPEAAANVRDLARDFVRRGSIGENKVAVDVCAAVIFAHVSQHPNEFILGLTMDIKSDVGELLSRYSADAERLVADAVNISESCGELLRKGLHDYRQLEPDQRQRLIDDLKRDAERYDTLGDRYGTDIKREYPPIIRRSAAIAFAFLGVLFVALSRNAVVWSALLFALTPVVWFTRFTYRLHRCTPAGEIMAIIRRQANAKDMALEIARTFIHEVEHEYETGDQDADRSWMQRPELDIDDCDMYYVRIAGCVRGAHRSIVQEYHFSIPLHLYEGCTIEQHRESFNAALFDELVKVTRKAILGRG